MREEPVLDHAMIHAVSSSVWPSADGPADPAVIAPADQVTVVGTPVTRTFPAVVGGKVVVVVVPNRHIFREPAILDNPGAFVSTWCCMVLAASGEETASATKREKANINAFSSRAFSGDPHGEKHAWQIRLHTAVAMQDILG